MTLEPGERRPFEVPEAFLLESNEAAMELPLGYTLKQAGNTRSSTRGPASNSFSRAATTRRTAIRLGRPIRRRSG